MPRPPVANEHDLAIICEYDGGLVTPLRIYRLVRVVSAALLLLAAGFHVLQAARGVGSVPRHLAFVGIDVVLAALLVARPRWAFYPALLLSIQQVYSHGLDLSQSFLGTAPLDKASLAVCLFFPTLMTLLYMERQEEASAGPPAARPQPGGGRDADER